MRKLIALALVLAGVASAAVPGWSVGPVAYYYVQDGCGADAGKRVLVISVSSSNGAHAVKSTDANYAEVLEATQYAYRNGKSLQLMTAPTAAYGTSPTYTLISGLLDNGSCNTQSLYKVNGFASK